MFSSLLPTQCMLHVNEERLFSYKRESVSIHVDLMRFLTHIPIYSVKCSKKKQHRKEFSHCQIGPRPLTFNKKRSLLDTWQQFPLKNIPQH